MASQLRYSREDLMASHAYVRPHVEAGYTLHGKFTADGEYVSPRTLGRWPAVRARDAALEARGCSFSRNTTWLELSSSTQ